jgi:hypothetical protein
MSTLLIVVLIIVFLAFWAGPRYYPAYAKRRGYAPRAFPAWSGRSNILLWVVGLLVLMWLFGLIRVGNFHSPFERTITTRPIIRIP